MIMNTEVVDEVGSSPGTQEITEAQQYDFIEILVWQLKGLENSNITD
ncbi:hypothetical protein OROGR_027882 [Orobanche gracilis]